jgi:hypothetical protein
VRSPAFLPILLLPAARKEKKKEEEEEEFAFWRSTSA